MIITENPYLNRRREIMREIISLDIVSDASQIIALNSEYMVVDEKFRTHTDRIISGIKNEIDVITDHIVKSSNTISLHTQYIELKRLHRELKKLAADTGKLKIAILHEWYAEMKSKKVKQ